LRDLRQTTVALARGIGAWQGSKAGGVVVTQPLDAVDLGDGERDAESIVSGKGLQATHRHLVGKQQFGQLACGV